MFTDIGPSAVHLLHPDGYASWKWTCAGTTAIRPHEMQLEHAGRGDAGGPRRAVARRRVDRPGRADRHAAGSRSTTRCRSCCATSGRCARPTSTTALWCNVRDVATCFGARTYGTDDDVVVDVAGTRWRLGAGGVSEGAVASPTSTTDHASLGALLLGGVAPTDARRRTPPDRPLARGPAPRRRPLRPPPRRRTARPGSEPARGSGAETPGTGPPLRQAGAPSVSGRAVDGELAEAPCSRPCRWRRG